MKQFFLSLKTSVWTLAILVGLFFFGSYMMPMHREVFGGMNDDILLAWVESSALGNLWYTWWFFAAVIGLIVLAINTVVCSMSAIRERWTRDDVARRLVPQIIHIGFLLILFAHLLGAGWGYRASGVVPEGAHVRLPDNIGFHLKSITVQTNSMGYMQDYAAEADIYDNTRIVATGTLGPNAPLFYKGMGIYLKHLSMESAPTALIEVARDPGAYWAFAGGMLFILGSVALLFLKWEKT